jgi:DNA-binding NarL/FixJ family response regulator
MTTTLLRSPRPSDRELGGRRRQDLLDRLSPRELEVLALMAEGRSNLAIGAQLAVGRKTVESHVSRVFSKLGLHDDRYGNRRVLAVLTLLGHASGGTTPQPLA